MKSKVKKNSKKAVSKSFVDYFVEKCHINTQAVQCIRTYGWGDKAVLRVEYDDFYNDYKPIAIAKQYLYETCGFYPKNLNFNNAHWDRTGCSVLNVWDVTKEEFEAYSAFPTVSYSKYHEDENYGILEFDIHNREQCELSYERRLYEYFNK
jgi:hypothetical protein